MGFLCRDRKCAFGATMCTLAHRTQMANDDLLKRLDSDIERSFAPNCHSQRSSEALASLDNPRVIPKWSQNSPNVANQLDFEN